MWSKKAIENMTALLSDSGPCILHPTMKAWHRVADTIMDRYAAGDSAESLADDYDYPLETIKAVLRIRPYRRGGNLS